ncbi:MarR family winged helix-turn-helix transcriptional regulator [Microbacterium sorbitolivorans]|uniref:MarR family transcriptional regulator n=1 Tax=Microbacterium sorbitolivorans TaxID=1867410 RepID=A0A367XVN2_9MICO|nr:MarR family transcriptional regulator [Microbacterium sorbitolivorans]RCK56851.1 MarR family transcriptional regulator [Microbacterium sorbitolivorans]
MSSSLPSRDDAIQAVEGEFMQMVSRFRRLIARRAEQLSPGLLPGAYKVFTTILQSGPLTASALVDQLMLDKSQLSRTITDLEKRGLIERTPDPNDRRSHLLSATEKGRAGHAAFHTTPETRTLRAKLDDWDIDDIHRLATLLHALNAD